jgi:hypothetical protein
MVGLSGKPISTYRFNRWAWHVMGEDSISREMSDVHTWIAGHEATCTERYKEIRQDYADHKASLEKLERKLVGIKKGIRVEMSQRIKAVEDDQHNQKVRQAYFVGAMAGASFVGGMLGPILSNVFTKLFQ